MATGISNIDITNMMREILEKQQMAAQKQTIEAAAEHLRNRDYKEEYSVVRSDKRKIEYPQDMEIPEVIDALKAQHEADNTVVSIKVDIDCYPMDGALALMEVLRLEYGLAMVKPTAKQSMFGTTFEPPIQLEVQTSATERQTVYWGTIVVPAIKGVINTGTRWTGKRLIFEINGQILRKDEQKIHDLCRQVQEYLHVRSIYRGKAIKISFRKDDREDDPTQGAYKFDPRNAPTFIDTSKVVKQSVYNDATQVQIDAAINGPIQHTQFFREAKLPLKRGVLLEGPYGTGKTLCAMEAAKLCEESGEWTMLYVDDVRDIDCALELAKQYQPCVVFAEDTDRAFGGERDTQIDKYLEALDGINAKNAEILVVLTTNDKDAIHPAAVRPGRIDTVVHIGAPDAQSGVKLLRQYGAGKIDGTDEELAEVINNTIIGRNASVYREVADWSQRLAVTRIAQQTQDAGQRTVAIHDLKITPTDIYNAAKGMEDHLRLMDRRDPPAHRPMVDFGIALGSEFTRAFITTVEDIRGEIGSAAREVIEERIADFYATHAEENGEAIARR